MLATVIGVSCTFSSHEKIWLNILLDTMTFKAALTNNGANTCSVQNEGFSSDVLGFWLSCWDGYSAFFDRKVGAVQYSHGSFSGAFGTTSENYQDSPFGNWHTYWTANVWGCWVSSSKRAKLERYAHTAWEFGLVVKSLIFSLENEPWEISWQRSRTDI